MRIPLLRPDRFLTATYPYVKWLYSRGVAMTIAAIGLLGLYLVARQWDVFVGTFVDMFTIAGTVWFALTLSCLKAIHEFGHAYTAKRFGLRVPTVGVALLVMVPVLYTDVNKSWKLTGRRQRVAHRRRRGHRRTVLRGDCDVRLGLPAERAGPQRRVPGRNLNLDHDRADQSEPVHAL